jgi:hypothetical protein
VPPDRVNHLAAEVLRDSGTILGRTIRLDEQQRLVLRGWEGDSRGRQANHEWEREHLSTTRFGEKVRGVIRGW